MSPTTILHVSDLHFGWPLRRGLPEQILREAHELAPDLVVVCGDLTQRAWPPQFRAARAWLERLPQPLLVIPGNHDVPLFNVFERWRTPLRRYRHHISAATDSVYQDDGLLAVGLSSARGATIDGGWLLPAQVEQARAVIAGRGPHQAVVVAVHHHFVRVPGSRQKPIREADKLLATFDAWGVDLVLTGHSHRAYVHRTKGGLLLVQGGTTTSRRGKGQDRGRNNYHVITLNAHHIEVTRRQYDREGGEFVPVLTETYPRRTPAGREVSPPSPQRTT
ncbi:MAG: metallophosphoesterase family protein [Anaerolineae bacterium]